MKHLGKRIFSALVSGVILFGSIGVGEAAPGKPSLRAADREMKPYKDYDPGDIYERAHRIIYGSQNRGRINEEYRTQIAVVLTGDEWLMVEDRIRNDIYRQLRKKFPREEFGVYKGTDVNTSLLTRAETIYAQERDKGGMWRLSRDVDDMPTGGKESHMVYGDMSNQDLLIGKKPRGFADLQLRDYVDAGREHDYDYVLALAMDFGGRNISEERYWIFYGNQTLRQNVWLRVRLVDVDREKYAYRNDIVLQGKVHNTTVVLGLPVGSTRGFNGPLFERAVHNALAEALRDIEVTP